ncbi:MAG: patatin-like phospholipase family protein [Lachnospiraceae bacterium]|jgi:predicted patatin/cPLA2 family phospholipase
MEKIGLVVEGGGMKCAYSAGILDCFLDDHVTFGYIIGVSAGSSSAASFAAGQRGRNIRFYTTHTTEKGYFGFDSFLKTGDLFGLDYIYSTLTNSDGADPIDYPAIARNPAEFVAVATDANTGLPHYFTKDDISQDNYEVFKASCALPAACRPRVIDGVPYFDGGVSDAIPAEKALKDGCSKVVIILTKPRDYVKQPEKYRKFYSIRCRKYPKIVEELNNRHIIYTAEQKHVFELEKQGKAFIFAPSEHLAMDTYSMDTEANEKLYKLGFSDYAQQKNGLFRFMGLSR